LNAVTDRPVILITGGTRGIGAATARLAAARGYTVIINYAHDAAAADALVAELEAGGASASAVKADVSSERDVVAMFGEIDRRTGILAALVNNVGVVDRQGRVEDITEARLTRMFATNVTSAFLCAREAVRRLSTAHGGRGGAIVNVSSAAARIGSPNEYVHYAASKAAIDAMTIGLAKEVAEEGIRVNAVRPGVIHTGIHASGGEPGRIARVKGSVPLKRGGQPEEVAHAILWLLSDEASYVTGTLLDVSGGR
jgi:NAD(P)-dependent dehydrogenase (short-subunit alcohol dehydrogenase family)